MKKRNLLIIILLITTTLIHYAEPSFLKSQNQNLITTGWILEIIADNPSDVYIDGRFKGKTPLLLSDISKNSKELILRSPWGSRKSKINFDPTISGLTVYHLKLEPLSGRLVLNSHPAELDIFINGEFKGQTPMTLDKMPAGEHLLTLQKERYFYEKLITIKAEKELKIFPRIEALFKLEFTAVLPQDAVITISDNDKTQEFTPSQKILLKKGSYKLKIHSIEHEPFERVVNITEDKKIEFSPNYFFPQIVFTNLKENSKIFLDGNEISGELLENIFNPKPGRHFINIQHASFLDFNQKINLVRNDSLEIPVIYKLSPQAEADQKKLLGYILTGVGIAGSVTSLLINNDDNAIAWSNSYESYSFLKYASLGGFGGSLGITGWGLYIIFNS